FDRPPPKLERLGPPDPGLPAPRNDGLEPSRRGGLPTGFSASLAYSTGRISMRERFSSGRAGAGASCGINGLRGALSERPAGLAPGRLSRSLRNGRLGPAFRSKLRGAPCSGPRPRNGGFPPGLAPKLREPLGLSLGPRVPRPSKLG